MPGSFEYRLMKSTGQANGHIRCADGVYRLHCTGLCPGETYALYSGSFKDQQKTADTNGCLSFSCSREGFLFLCNQHGMPVLWQESNDGNGLFRARQALQKLSPPKKALSVQPPPKPPEPAPEKEPAPPKESRIFRPPSAAPMAASLPTLHWPEHLKKLQAAIAAALPFCPFPLPGFRCVRMPGPSPAIPFYVTGYKTENSRVTQLLYALPGHPLKPPVFLPGCRWKSGWWYTLQHVKG